MSNLSQYRTSLAIFSLGLLWVVSEVVGDGQEPAPLDTATKSIVHRLAKSGDKAGETSSAPYELAVSQADDAPADANSRDGASSSPAHSANPFALDGAGDDGDDISAAPQAEPAPAAQPAPAVGPMHY
jgi:hypothetical protein